MPDVAANTEVTVGPPDLGWTVTTHKVHVDAAFVALQRQHDLMRLHYDVLIDEIDKRYQARFLAAEIAVTSAFAAQEKAISAALSSAERAVSKAELASDKRFESVNEFRSQLSDQTRTFMPRAEVEAVVKALDAKTDSLTSRMDRRDAAGAGGQQVWGYVAAGIGVAVGIAGVVIALLR